MTGSSSTLTPITTTPILPGIYICPASILAQASQGLTLDRYQELMRLPIAAFNGLNKPDEYPVYECSTIWKQSERAAVAAALVQAEEMREAELNYHLVPKYVENVVPYLDPLILPMKYLIKLGERTVTDIELGVVLNHGLEASPNDPVVVTVTTTVTDTDEVKVFYPGLDCEIHPTKISIASGVATLYIPRSRLVNPNLLDDRDDHLSYYENDNFLPTVDVKRVYYDESAAVVYNMYGINSAPISDVDTEQSAYGRILDMRLSIITHARADYAGGTWTFVCRSACRNPDSVTVRYYSGAQASINTEVQTIRLAHTLMPNKPCSCPTVHQMWQEDVMRSKTFTPYGDRYGALQAWMSDSRAKVGHGGKFPSMKSAY